jgi:hypothetical protein
VVPSAGVDGRKGLNVPGKEPTHVEPLFFPLDPYAPAPAFSPLL